MNIKLIIMNWHNFAMLVIVVLYIAYKAAYPYLNPGNLQWQNAVIQATLAVVTLLVYGHGYVSTQLRLTRAEALLGGRPTVQVPTQRASLDNPDNYR